MPPPTERRGRARIRVDRVACTGHGVCASVLPETFRLDEWGYPVVDDPQVDARSRQTRAVIRLCPARALYLES